MNFKLLLPLLLLASCSSSALSSQPFRQTSSGPINGLRHQVLNTQVDAFLGIPFARPPTGELRFRPPQPPQPWTVPINTTRPPHSCYQELDTAFSRFPGVEMWNPNTDISEDCLYLNVWQPMGGSGGSKAVMVWIYGGSFDSGTSTLDLYDGRWLAAHGDVVVVSMQYRTGALGFLYLERESRDWNANADAPGNMGLLDQHAALKWVIENAKVFGGDAGKVTLFGESAGAASVGIHLLSPLSKYLFRAAILQSGTSVSPWAVGTPERANRHAVELALRLQPACANHTAIVAARHSANASTKGTLRESVLACLKAAAPADITRGQSLSLDESGISLPFAPTVDGHFLLSQPTRQTLATSPHKASVLLGVTRDEGNYFLAYYFEKLYPVLSSETPSPISRAEFEATLRKLLKADQQFVVDNVAFEYGTPPGSGEANYRDALDDMLGDSSFKCPIVELAQAHAAAGRRAYVYQFNHLTSADPWPAWMGVLHGYEIDTVFGLPLDPAKTKYRDVERWLSGNVVRYWTNFAKTGDPNLGASTNHTWPVYTMDTRQVLHINSDGFTVESGLRDRACAYWRDVVPQLRQVALGVHPCNSATSLKSSLLSHWLIVLLFLVLLV